MMIGILHGKEMEKSRAEYQRAWRAKNPERCREYSRKDWDRHKEQRREHARAYYKASPKTQKRLAQWKRDNMDKVVEYVRNWRKRNPNGTKAHNAAIRNVKSQPCEVCGVEATDRHHDDYLKPESVRHLCRKHHAEHHRGFKPRKKP